MVSTYSIAPVNSCSYYKFQVEIDLATNRDFNIKIAHKAYIYGFQPCSTNNYDLSVATTYT